MDFSVQGCFVVVLQTQCLLIWIWNNLKNICFAPQMWKLQFSVMCPWLSVLVLCIICKFLSSYCDLLHWEVLKIESWNLKSRSRPKPPRHIFCTRDVMKLVHFVARYILRNNPPNVNCHSFRLQSLRSSFLRCLAWSFPSSLFYIVLWCSDPLFLYSDVFVLCKILTIELLWQTE